MPLELVFVLEQVFNGLLVGVTYLMIALGLSLIFSLGGIVNLAHGGFYAIGAYALVVLAPYLGYPGAFVAAPLVVALLGIVVERLLLRRFYRADPVLSLLLTCLRPRNGDRAGSQDWLRRHADPVRDPGLPLGPVLLRGHDLLALPLGAARRRRRLGRGLVAVVAADRVRPRRARGRAGPGHGGGARHLARPLPHGRGGTRHRPCRPRGWAHGADHRRPPGDGHGSPDGRLRRRRHRGPRFVLGRRRGGTPRRRRTRARRLLLRPGRRGLDVPPHAARPARAPARAVRRAPSRASNDPPLAERRDRGRGTRAAARS